MIPKRLATTECRKKGRKRGRVRIGRKAREGKRGRVRIDGKRAKEKREREKKRKGEGRKERRRKSALGERGARSTCTLYERNPRRRRWAVVHFMHAYARLYWIPCTTTTYYLNTMHAYARLSRIPCTTPTDSSISGLRFGPICSIFYENSE